MNTIGERIKYLRKEVLSQSQKEFGETIGLKPNSVSCIETGTNSPTEQNIKAICREFNINEEWIRNGIEPMYKDRTRNQEIGKFVNDVMDTPDEAFKKRFIESLTRLDAKDWEALERIATKLLAENKKEG